MSITPSPDQVSSILPLQSFRATAPVPYDADRNTKSPRDDGRRGIDRGVAARPPATLVGHFPRGGIHGSEPLAREEHGHRLAVQASLDRRGVAGRVVRGLPEDCAGGGVERHDAGPSGAADIGEHVPGHDQRGRRGPEEPLAHAEGRVGVDVPYLAAGFEVETMQPSLRAECVNASADDHGRGSRPVIETEVVPVARLVSKLPEGLAVLGLQRLDNLFVSQPMKEDKRSRGDGGSR